ncbi:dihydropteroate synthase [bacterium]|nr:dihydropteroate synthase [bacterium]
MKNFVIKEIINSDLKKEIDNIGFDNEYSRFAADKFQYKTLKIYSLTPAQGNILKQTALSEGADCATHRETITCRTAYTDCILGGSYSQLKKIAQKLENQPFGLSELKDEIIKLLENKSSRTKLAGVLNLTTNSFSDGGLYYDFDKAKEKFLSLIDDGADMIDIGAESTKPYSEAVPADKQLEKLLPILEFAKDKNVKISIDTRSSIVADEVLKLGNYVINDVSGFDYDDKMPEIISKHGAGVIIQHSKGSPENMQNNPDYECLMDEIFLSLKEKIDIAHSHCIDNIIIDAGIGFGKNQRHNVELIKRAAEFKTLGYPVMLGISRKSFLGIKSDDNDLKDALSLGFGAVAAQNGIDWLRVHNVKLHRQFLDVYHV